MKRFETSLIFIFFLSGFSAAAQEGARISGRVLERETGTPIPFASVFFDKTSVGSIADSLGNYELSQVPPQFTDLIVSSLGYETSHTTVSLSSGHSLNLDLKMKSTKVNLKEAVISGTRDIEWNGRYQRFFGKLIGTSAYAASCKIKNAGIITFSETYDGRLKAFADLPLEIDNDALGYKISLSLLQFEMTETSFSTRFYLHYNELKATDAEEKLKWLVNRLKCYKGSQRHFLKSVIEKRSREEGFLVFYDREEAGAGRDEPTRLSLRPVEDEILLPHSQEDLASSGLFRILRKGSFEIHYLNKTLPRSERWYPDFPHPVSWLTIDQKFLLCPPNGNVRSNSNDLVSGDMDNYRVADILPQDYDAVNEEAQIYLMRFGEMNSIEGTVTDSVNGKPIGQAKVFVNNSFCKTYTDQSGRFKLRKIPPGKHSLVVMAEGHALQSRKIEVNIGKTTVIPIALGIRKDFAPTTDLNDFRKAMYFRRYFIGSSTSAVTIVNPQALQIQISGKKTKMRADTVVEIEDRRTGYKLNYFLQESEFIGWRGKSKVTAYSSFDSLKAKTENEEKKWREKRNEYFIESRGTTESIDDENLPHLPIEYIPVDELITDPEVWEVIDERERNISKK